jgi:hypothetical protein
MRATIAFLFLLTATVPLEGQANRVELSFESWASEPAVRDAGEARGGLAISLHTVHAGTSSWYFRLGHVVSQREGAGWTSALTGPRLETPPVSGVSLFLAGGVGGLHVRVPDCPPPHHGPTRGGEGTERQWQDVAMPASDYVENCRFRGLESGWRAAGEISLGGHLQLRRVGVQLESGFTSPLPIEGSALRRTSLALTLPPPRIRR